MFVICIFRVKAKQLVFSMSCRLQDTRAQNPSNNSPTYAEIDQCHRRARFELSFEHTMHDLHQQKRIGLSISGICVRCDRAIVREAESQVVEHPCTACAFLDETEEEPLLRIRGRWSRWASTSSPIPPWYRSDHLGSNQVGSQTIYG
jgi:hypothetical protein